MMVFLCLQENLADVCSNLTKAQVSRDCIRTLVRADGNMSSNLSWVCLGFDAKDGKFLDEPFKWTWSETLKEKAGANYPVFPHH